MTLTRLTVGQAGVADRRGFIDAAADLADDSLTDVEQLGVVAEADVGLLHLAVDLDEDRVTAVDHDVGDVIVGEQRLQRAVAQVLALHCTQAKLVFALPTVVTVSTLSMKFDRNC